MAVLEINFSKIKQQINKPDLTVKELEDILFDFGLEIDSINDDELKIDVTAERVDLLSFEGFIRALKAYLEIDFAKKYDVKKSEYKVNIDSSISELKTYTLSAVVRNLDLDSDKIKEIINVQEKLHFTFGRKRKIAAIGIYPLDKIEFPIIYKALKPEDIHFIPLGESRVMNGNEIIKEHPTGVKYSHLLENQKKYTIFEDNKGNILSMPPIINSDMTGKVTEDTKDLFIECTGRNIHKLKYIINILCCMFSDFGGEIYSLDINYPDKVIKSPNLDYEEKIVSLNYINNLLGTNISIEDSSKLLRRMQYLTEIIDDDKIRVLIPPFRSDILHDNDIADDLARAYGFSNIKLRSPKVVSYGEKDRLSIIQENIINIMVSLGMQQVMPLVLSSVKEIFTNFNIKGENYVSLGFSEEKSLNVISNWLMPKLLKTLVNNQHNSFPQNIFASDFIVKKDNKEEVRSKTLLHTSCLMANSKVSFTEISSILLTLCNILGYKLKLEEQDYPYYIKGRSAKVIIDGLERGTIGELSPEVLSNSNYAFPVCGFEIEI